MLDLAFGYFNALQQPVFHYGLIRRGNAVIAGSKSGGLHGAHLVHSREVFLGEIALTFRLHTETSPVLVNRLSLFLGLRRIIAHEVVLNRHIGKFRVQRKHLRVFRMIADDEFILLENQSALVKDISQSQGSSDYLRLPFACFMRFGDETHPFDARSHLTVDEFACGRMLPPAPCLKPFRPLRSRSGEVFM